MISYEYAQKLLKKADDLIISGNVSEAKEIIVKVFGIDTNYIHAVILTESNPEYSIYSKKFSKILNDYYINTLMNNISAKLFI